MTPEFQAIVDLIKQFGIWIIFAWLYLDERKNHNSTREKGAEDLKQARRDHMADIREIAGMRQNLYSVQGPAVPRTPEKEQPAIG